MKLTASRKNLHLVRTSKVVPCLAALALFLLFIHSPASAADPLRKSLVKIFTTVQYPNYYEPWRTGSQESMSGSGCVISGNRILTNAHVVSNQIFIQVQKEGDTKKYTAKREFVAHDCDLAILKVVDPKFFKGTKPVTFGGIPFLKDKIAVYGFPVGGEKLSITEGGISRIEVITYAHSYRTLLGLQTDAAINPGNSGGPAFSGKKMVGIAFQDYRSNAAQSTGYLIPVPIIKKFLSEIKKGINHNVPGMGIYAEDMENDALRAYYGVKSSQTGILVNKVVYGSSAWDKIRENDVLLSVDGHSIANDGTIVFRKGERVNFFYALDLHHIGDEMKFKILRGGKPLNVSIKLKEEVRLVPYPQYDVNPSYFIFDGLVFTPFTTNYSYTMKETGPAFLSFYYDGLPSESMKQVVLVSHVIPHEINKGYDTKYENLVVRKVNGQTISEMKDLISAFQKPVDGRHTIEFDSRLDSDYKIILDAGKSQQATTDIMKTNNIPSDRSADLK